MSNPYEWIIPALVAGVWALDALADVLNLGHGGNAPPPELRDQYDDASFARSREYLASNTRLGLLQGFTNVAALLGLIAAGGFDWADRLARTAALGPVLTGLLFAGIVTGLKLLLTLPFSVYKTFVIEERFGFNRTTPGTFAGDLVKGVVLTAILGGLVFAGIIWFFEATGSNAWLWAWLAFSAFQLIVTWLAPVLILPVFNKFVPLADAELNRRITEYARAQGFALQGIYTMDGSKRSSKANAFFAGFGKFRRLVLFDTLIQKHTPDELMAVLAHEVGHYKLGHIPKSTVLSIVASGVMFRVLAEFVGSAQLFEAFRMTTPPSTYAGLVFASILIGPVMRLLSLPSLALSRKFEYEADEYSARTFGDAEALAQGLKRLSVDSLSNPKPHRLKVLMDYTHPPVIQRIAALRAGAAGRR